MTGVIDVVRVRPGRIGPHNIVRFENVGARRGQWGIEQLKLES